MIDVVKAPPFLTVQDLGWRTGRAIGLPPGGAMHAALLAEANRLVGNAPGLAGLEWALGPGVLRFRGDGVVAVLRDADVKIDSVTQLSAPMVVGAGSVLEITPRGRDRFLYVAVRGGIDVPEVMNARSTYLPGGFGGYQGRRIKSGDSLSVGETPRATPADSGAHSTAFPRDPLLLRVTRGPQWDRFDAAARAALFSGQYVVAPASDRMGYRLLGAAVHPRERATLPSEAACPGAVQIPDGGEPIVLMPDGPTVGGYPKLAVVIPADLGELAQCQPGRAVRFREISLEEARGLRR